MQRYLRLRSVVNVMEMRRAMVLLIGGLVLFGGTAVAAPNDPGWEQQWNLAKIRADKAWGTTKGAGVIVAIVDTGVDLTHIDLKARLVGGVDLVNGGAPQDDNGHGTFMAGIVAASTGNGEGVASVAPSAKIMPVKVLNSEGEGQPETVAQGIRWAVSHGADVINLSLAETSGGGIQLPVDFFKNSELADAIRDAAAAGRFVAIAAGNDFSSSGGDPQTSYDAQSPGVLVVGAATSSDKRAAYSNFGQGLDVLAPGGGSSSDPTTAACQPNDPLLSTFWEVGQSDRYGLGCGTSMAVAHVSGIAALLRARGYSASSAAQRIVSTAKDLGSGGWDSQTGHGRVDAYAAVGASSGGTPVAPPKPPAKKTTPKKKVTVAAKPTSTPVARPGTIAPTPSPTGLLLAADDAGDAIPAPRKKLIVIATAMALIVGLAHPIARIGLRAR